MATIYKLVYEHPSQRTISDAVQESLAEQGVSPDIIDAEQRAKLLRIAHHWLLG